jgi:YebC/PmpR family DNA-binding regulatory protein
MSGHSKWHSIRRSKAILDNKRGAVFTKLAREIAVAVKQGGGGDIDANFRLRVVVLKARAQNMPADNIERAIKKGLGVGEDAAQFEDIIYEGYGPGGVAIMVVALTDNRNRTASDVRSAFNKNGGNLGESGSVGWMFEHVGLIRLPAKGKDVEELTLTAIDAGANDVQELEDEDGNVTLYVYTAFEDLRKVQEALEAQKITIESSEDTWISKTPMDLDPAKSVQVLKLMDRLEDLDDVQNVYTNLNLTEEALALS